MVLVGNGFKPFQINIDKSNVENGFKPFQINIGISNVGNGFKPFPTNIQTGVMRERFQTVPYKKPHYYFAKEIFGYFCCMSTDLKERKPNRWKGFDYSSENAYFITICVDKQFCVLGKIIDKKMVMNAYGKIIEYCWNDLPNHYENCVLDAFIIMPNHIHGIIIIDNSVFKSANTVGNGFKPFPTKKHGLSEMVRALKTFSSRRINEILAAKDILTNDTVRNGFKPFPTDTLSNDNAENGFKPFPMEIPNIPSLSQFKWQKSFHDHIIRDFKALEKIRDYISANPANWEKDTFFNE